MRISLNLPDTLYREAKIAAVERGITLRELMTSALEHELHGATSRGQALNRIEFPLIKSDGGTVLKITPEDIRRLEQEDDLRRSGLND